MPCPYAGRVVDAARRGRATVAGRQAADHGGAGRLTPPPVGRAGRRTPTYREEEQAGSGNVLIGYGTGHGGVRAGAAGAAPADRAAPAAPPRPPRRRPATAARRRRRACRVVISPLVRRLAREHGVDLRAVAGTGPGGVIRRADVEAALTAAPPRRPRPRPRPRAGRRRPRTASVDPAARASARPSPTSSPAAAREIPEATVWVDVDATALLETRAAINAAPPGRAGRACWPARPVLRRRAAPVPRAQRPGRHRARSEIVQSAGSPRLRRADRPRAASCRSCATPAADHRASWPRRSGRAHRAPRGPARCRRPS